MLRYRIAWALGLLVGTLFWAMLIHVAIEGQTALQMSTVARFGVVLGIAAPPYLGSALIAGIVWAITKKPAPTMWAWTVLLLVILAFMGVGAARVTSSI